MKGDRIVVEEHHRKVAARIVPPAHALADAFREQGIDAAVLGQGDYFVLPPRSNDARRRADPDWLGPLTTEHKIIARQRWPADYIITGDHDVSEAL